MNPVGRYFSKFSLISKRVVLEELEMSPILDEDKANLQGKQKRP